MASRSRKELFQKNQFWVIVEIFVLPITFSGIELQKTSEKQNCAEKIFFLVKVFLFSGILRFERDMTKKPVFGYPSKIAYISGLGGRPSPKIDSEVYFSPNFLLLPKKSWKNAVLGPKKIFVVFGFLKKFRRKFFFSKNPENFTK